MSLSALATVAGAVGQSIGGPITSIINTNKTIKAQRTRPIRLYKGSGNVEQGK